MALVPYNSNPIILSVSDRKIGDTLIRQRVRFVELLHTQNRVTGESEATILTEVTMFAAENDGYGSELTGAGFSRRPVRLEANNRTLVDARPEVAGTILAVYTGQTASDWHATIAGFEQDTMLQGDFFEYLRDNGLPGTIRQMIEHHILQADKLGRFV